MIHKPYVILAPKYQHNVGGIRVLHGLNNLLKFAHYESYLINSVDEFPTHLDKENTIAIYPEIYKGNPLNAKHVARYVLYYPGEMGGDKVFDESEMVFCFSRMVEAKTNNKVSGNLYIDTTDLDIFKDYGLERFGACYYIGKGDRYFDKKLLPDHCIAITKDFPATRYGVANLLNWSKVLYCFDPMTILMQEAALCGCPTLLLSDNWKEHLLSRHKLNGVAIDSSGIPEAKKTMLLVREKVEEINSQTLHELYAFIEITQGYKNERSKKDFTKD